MKDRTKPQTALDRKENKLLANSKYFRKLVLKDLREIKKRKASRWKDALGKL